MSGKNAKRIRKFLKSQGVDVTHTKYKYQNGCIVLSDCGRKAYKEAKKLAKAQ